jgi:hypothetical protein
VPFLVVTGYDRHDLPPTLRDRPYIAKPFAAETLLSLASRTFLGDLPSG